MSFHEFIIAMSIVSDAVDHDGDGKADKGESRYDGKEAEFAFRLAMDHTGGIDGKVNIKAGAVAEGVAEARRLQTMQS